MLVYVYAKSRWYRIGKKSFFKYVKKWEKAKIKCALLDKKYKFNANDISFNDLNKFEIRGDGYSPGGQELKGKKVIQAFVQNDGKEHTFFDADDIRWHGTFDTRWAVLYDSKEKNQLIFCIDFLAEQSVWNGCMTVMWANTGIVDMTVEFSKMNFNLIDSFMNTRKK